MKSIVISQPMYFPWPGMLEQVRHADTFVHYDDVPFSKGSFTNRVQVKTASGRGWLTVPVSSKRTPIVHLVDVDRERWTRVHRETLEQALAGAPYLSDALMLFDVSVRGRSFCDIAIRSLEALARYFDVMPRDGFVRSSTLNVPGASSQRVRDVVLTLGGTHYVTGHGAQHYLDHELLEECGIETRYLDYALTPYLQRFGPFTPYVTALTLVAHEGRAGAQYLNSPTTHWKRFLHERLQPSTHQDAA
ncbi:MAG: hypothetical protein ACI81R_000577 [Bradymonadia bacterium]|jgi:hypothetical protein